MLLHKNCAFLIQYLYFILSKKKLSYKSSALRKGGIHKGSEFSLTEIEKGKIDIQFVNVGSKLLILVGILWT